MSIIAIAPSNRIIKSVASKFGGIKVGAVRVTAMSKLDEGVVIHNVSRIGDKSFELVLDAEYCAESSYRLHKAGWMILETAAPTYQVAWSSRGTSVSEADTYARWNQELRESKSPHAREYYKTLLAMHGQQIKRAISQWQEQCQYRSHRSLTEISQEDARSAYDHSNWSGYTSMGHQAPLQKVSSADGFTPARPAQKRPFNENGTATTVSGEAAARARPRAFANQFEVLSDMEDDMAVDAEDEDEDGQGTQASASVN
ncbi:hypothetical protein LPJ81_004235 [Coemansia sp. IMI 209127]|nr:hypothetical protein LPJ81_004235 [Coemansia sp. IMI 209127]